MFSCGATRHRLKTNLRFFPFPSYPTDRLFWHRLTAECASQPQAFSRRHFKPSEQMRSPDGAKIKYNRWLHNRNHFLETGCGRMFYFTQTKMFLQTALAVCLNRGASAWRRKKKGGKLDKSSPSRHQMTALHWKLSENDFLRPARRCPWAAAGWMYDPPCRYCKNKHRHF